ncbi:RagB/SusD family nutrient uptake outer membrane protein [Bacteroides pyogenes]|uniref:RagB/SusD family nutrient uptake outer membrane protein n=1 Tax=Bacteroides pyogenes TaxID=310300 RepID=UPI0011E3C525|nr:RagB/SusD family nutrient uptake outer membrane protein [Bacteroides pyogenes]MBR8707536.1 hypothetical protein [Bacteroides pyogenes]MBR8716268.1 hypothetical protein [Bacteroides pyogenes]MBR8745796.1 hypothetical protein [Bacteroides pyogenes]MBR8756105.1 hypothetical protein [Bacteroides pyogenes]MBR8779407.1 hypothetical protein [Bacteroides pyogenes]
MKYLYVSLIIMLLGLTSCNHWLDVEPKTSIPTDKQFESEPGFKDALTGIYLKLGTTQLYAGDLTYAYLDELAGLYSVYPGYDSDVVYNQSITFDYQNRFLGKKNGIYSSLYNIIANINNFLEYVDKNKDVLKTERYYETMKGEALGLRAFLHFDLLRLFGPVYKEHPVEKAIPYRTSFNKKATPVITANEVVEVLLKDLKEAETLLVNSDPCDFFTDHDANGYEQKNHFLVNREFRMNLYAVKAMLARVYCYKGDGESKELAVKYAREVINASNYFTLYTSQTASNYNSIRYEEQIFGITVNEFANLLVNNKMGMESTNPQDHFATLEENFNYFYEKAGAGNTDWRRNPEMFEVGKDAGTVYVFCRKYNQKPLISKSLNKYIGADAVPLIRLPEMYYILAECIADPSESVKALNTVRFARGISYNDEIVTAGYDELDASSLDNVHQTKRINEIMKEYRKEYFGEGQLFYFFKAHYYSTYYGCGEDNMTEAHYQMPLPDNEYLFGNNSK